MSSMSSKMAIGNFPRMLGPWRFPNSLDKLAVQAGHYEVSFDRNFFCFVCLCLNYKNEFIMTAARTSGADNRNCLLDCHSAVLENVLSGNFPRRDICKMNSTRLKVFVGHLEHLTRVIATSLGNENFQTLSWCCSVVGDLKTAKNGVLREQMIQLILNSCNFFRELKLKHPRSPNLNLNDENFDITKISPIEIKSDTISGNIDFKIDSFKRKLDCTSVIEEDNEIKRRRTLRSVSKPVISVNVNKQSLSSLKQSHFWVF